MNPLIVAVVSFALGWIASSRFMRACVWGLKKLGGDVKIIRPEDNR